MEKFGEIFNYTTDSDLNYISFEINNPSPAYNNWDRNGYFLWIYDGHDSSNNRNRVTYIPITGNAVAWNSIKNLFGGELDKFKLEKWLKNHMNITLEYLN